MRTDTGPAVVLAMNASLAVFEGMSNAVTVLTAPGGDLTGASVAGEDSVLVVRESVCAGTRCAVVLSVADTLADVGRSIPAPADATNRYLRITRAGIDDHRALFSVLPLDAIRNVGDMATVRGTYFAASLDSVDTTVFRGAPGREAVRWFVFGDAVLRGTVDVSAGATGPGPGGGAGATMGAAMGPGAGQGGSATAGAGGGGSGEDGVAGEGAMAGMGGAGFSSGCAADAYEPVCGGGGGGAAGGPGGGGGGTFALFVLGSLEADVDILATGGDGATGGGGGGGGRVWVTASEAPGARLGADVAGGAGGARAAAAGGLGAGGESVLLSDGGEPVTLTTRGPWIVRDPSYTVAGMTRTGAQVRVETIDGIVLGTATATDGSFSIPVTLVEGLNRLRVIARDTAGAEHRAWQGNHFEFERRGATVLPVGALYDVAYLP